MPPSYAKTAMIVPAVPAEWAEDNLKQRWTCCIRWRENYRKTVELLTLPHSAHFIAATTTEHCVPRTHIDVDHPAGALRARLSGLHSPLVTESPVAAALPDRVPFANFDSCAVWQHVADAAYYPQPSGELSVVDVLLRVLLFLSLDHQELAAVSAVSRAWRAAAAYLLHWCLLPPLFGLNCELYKAANAIAPFAIETVDGVDVVDRDGFMNTLRRRWEMKQDVAKHTRDGMAQENRYAVLVFPMRHVFAVVFSADWLATQLLVMGTRAQSAASEFIVIFLVEYFVLAAALCFRLIIIREPFLLMQHQMTDLWLHTCLVLAVIFSCSHRWARFRCASARRATCWRRRE
jgi:hypothetical protein